MGVNINSYVVYGVKLNRYDDNFSDKFNEVDNTGPTCILDGMCGEWMVFGKILFDSGDARHGFENGDEFKTLDLGALAEIEHQYRREFAESYPEFVHLIEEPFRLHAFLYYH